MPQKPIPESLKPLMTQFCNIVIPEYKKRRGYINVKAICEQKGIDPRTYYNWVGGSTVPSIRVMADLLEAKGYKLEIVPDYGEPNPFAIQNADSP